VLKIRKNRNLSIPFIFLSKCLKNLNKKLIKQNQAIKMKHKTEIMLKKYAILN
jgi:hypothetical protein